MRVRTLTPHNNKYGEKYRKAEGDEYDAPDGAAQSLAAQGFVAVAEDQDVPARPAKRRPKRSKPR
jgi:hypothetical protein